MAGDLANINEKLRKNIAPEIARLLPPTDSYFLEVEESTEYCGRQHDRQECSQQTQRPQNPPPQMMQVQEQQSQQMQQGGHGGGGVFKLTTLKVKLGRAAAFAAGAAASLVAASSNPILFLIALVATAAAALDMSNATLSEIEASILWTMSISPILINIDVLRRRTNEERARYGLSSLTDPQFDYALHHLEQLHCIERSGLFDYRLLEHLTFQKALPVT